MSGTISPSRAPMPVAQKAASTERSAMAAQPRGILRARADAGATFNELCIPSELQYLQARCVDELLMNAGREVIDALKKTLTTLVDLHGSRISETLLLISHVTCSRRLDSDGTDEDILVHAVLEGFASKHLDKLRAAADRCDLPAFEELLERASVDLGGGPRAAPPEGSFRALLRQVTSCSIKLESALKRLLSDHLKAFPDQLERRWQGAGALPGGLSDRAVSTCLATLRRAADQGDARAYLAALARLRRHPRRVVAFSRKDSVITMPAQV